MSDLEFVTVVVPEVKERDRGLPTIGVPELWWQGRRLTFPTVGSVTVEFGEDHLATATVRIPVLVIERVSE